MADPFYTDVYESNTSFAVAAILGEGVHDIAGTGVDWYRFDSLSGTLSFVMTPATAALDLNMELYNAQKCLNDF